ncbi:MAG: TonB family protein [Ignavibacteria bacterium]|nr:TonB family protein [Ignavibacteria bacterium]
MTTASIATSVHGVDYGAVELKRVLQKYWVLGLSISITIHFIAVGTYYLVGILGQEEEPAVMVRIMKYSDLGPPPSIANVNTPPPIAVSAPVAKPTVGAPVPVPDAEVSPEQTIATQTEMSQQIAPVMETGEGEFAIVPDIFIEDDTPPADFVPVEKQPQIVKKVKPVYPDLAMRAGLEGKVWVKIWVDKEGKVREVRILKSDAEIFDEPAIEAAKQFIFTPAYMNKGPVSVWVSVPFKFQLADRN